MLRNYFISAIKQLLKNRWFSVINITGLSIGLVCSFLIFLNVHTELSYDKHFKDSGDIYRLAVNSRMGDNQFQAAVTGGPFAQTLENELPEVIGHTRLREGRMTLLSSGEKNFYEENILFADSNFFSLFNYDLLIGKPSRILIEPGSLVISEEMAFKFFGDGNPIGKLIKWNNKENYTITGVFKKNNAKSHLNFDILVSFSTLYQNERFKNLLQSYFAYTTLNYIKVNKGTDEHLLVEKIAGIVDKYMGEGLAEYNGKYEVFLQPITDIYLKSDILHEMKTSGDLALVYIFAGAALLILLIASINFINLSTARSSQRSLEVGLRKVFGANKNMLFRQFILESLTSVFISLLISLILLDLVLPVFNKLSGNDFTIPQLLRWDYLLLILFGVAFIGLLSGTYPSLYLSGFKPINALNKRMFGGIKKSGFRNFMVVIQFMISVFLISGTLLIYQQLNYINKKDLGIDQNDIVVISLRDSKMLENYSTLKAELANIPGVYNLTGASSYLGNFQQRRGFYPEGKGLDDMVLTLNLQADANYLNLFNGKFSSGRNFFENSIADSNAVVINQAYADQLGWEEPVGKHIYIPGASEKESTPLRIVGVIENFIFASLHQEVKPLIIMNDPSMIRYLSLKIKPEKQLETIQLISSKWEALFPGFPFEYFMQQSKYDEMYKKEVNMGQLFIYFSLLALFIAVLGLLGLASYSTQQRTKEIGVRKVLGSTTSEILMVLTKDFSKWVVLAIILTSPIAYFAMDRWLGNFAFHTKITPGIFIISGLLAFLVANITILAQAIKASNTNPVDSLKYE
ncbi:MAG: ABC transporter permease [Bacteroidales bacterium]|nr:ABC transporter permease [Bacteroidales bacterium]MCF8405125.1 ABC transporter permease [Bacteroidales bacterium]